MKVLTDIGKVYFADGSKLTESLIEKIKSGEFKPKTIICNISAYSDDFEHYFYAKGKAVCDKDDVFDLKVGLSLSYKKAINKIYVKIIKECDAFKRNSDKHAKKIGEIKSQCELNIIENSKDLLPSRKEKPVAFELIYDDFKKPTSIIGAKELDPNSLIRVEEISGDKHTFSWKLMDYSTNTHKTFNNRQIVLIEKPSESSIYEAMQILSGTKN